MTEPTKEAVEKARADLADYEALLAKAKILPRKHAKDAITLRDALTASEAREAALRDALAFYADRNIYATNGDGFTEVDADGGNKARAALVTP